MSVDRIQLLELDLDIRLRDLWAETEPVERWTLGLVARFVRAAYGMGYRDALRDEPRGLLYTEHGYRVPS